MSAGSRIFSSALFTLPHSLSILICGADVNLFFNRPQYIHLHKAQYTRQLQVFTLLFQSLQTNSKISVMQKILLPSIVTAYNPNWPSQLEELKERKITCAALFLTTLNAEQRQECYRKLEEIRDLKIPFVHLRTDMAPSELKFLIERFKTERFNIHPVSQFPLTYDLSNFQSMIYVENSGYMKETDLTGFAGICLDVAHLEDWKLRGDREYENVCSLLKKYPVGANHLSVVTKTPVVDQSGDLGHSYHLMTDFSQFDYLKKYPENYFGDFVAIELINSISDQLKLIEHLQKQIWFLH